VLRSLDQIHEADDRVLEALLQLAINKPLLLGERVVGLGQREHVGVDAGAEMFERHPQRPQPPIAADHRR
jgi:hypothetical protein